MHLRHLVKEEIPIGKQASSGHQSRQPKKLPVTTRVCSGFYPRGRNLDLALQSRPATHPQDPRVPPLLVGLRPLPGPLHHKTLHLPAEPKLRMQFLVPHYHYLSVVHCPCCYPGYAQAERWAGWKSWQRKSSTSPTPFSGPWGPSPVVLTSPGPLHKTH